MKAVIDTNVLLDFFSGRADYEAASKILSHAAKRTFEGFVAAHAVTTMAYFIERDKRHPGRFREQLSILLKTCRILSVDEKTIREAANTAVTDYEDAVVEIVSFTHGVDCIVTRNIKDFARSRVLALSPAQFLKMLDEESDSSDLVREPAPSYHTRPRVRRGGTGKPKAAPKSKRTAVQAAR